MPLVISEHFVLKRLSLIRKSWLSNDVFLSLGCIEVNWQFDSLGLVYSQRKVRLLLKVLETESLQVLFS